MRIRGLALAVFGLGVGIAGLGARGWTQVAGASGGTQASPPSSGVTLHVVTRETLVDVTVTDSKGNPVHGLTQHQFTVKEDGKVQAIRSFEEFGKDAPVAKAPPKLPPNVYTNLQPPAASSAVNILLLDGLNTAPPDASNPQEIAWSFTIQTRVKQEAAKYLKSMPEGTRVAVLGLSRGLRILQGFSSDPALLSAAVDTMEMNMDGRASTPPQWCAQQDMRNQVTLEALEQIAGDVTGIKGKKNLIWFTAGFPTITDPRVNGQPICTLNATGANFHPEGRSPQERSSAPLQGDGLRDYGPALLKTYGLLAAAQIAVYPVGAQALSTIANPIGGGLIDITSPAYPEFSADDDFSMETMAEATGGAAYYNTNDLAGAVAKAVDKGASYYTLSYVPPGKKYDYGHHSIKVSVDQDGLHLLYRKSYDAVDPATIKPAPGLTLATSLPEGEPVDMRMAMSRSMPNSQQILFDVQVESSTEPAKAGEPAVMGVLDEKFKGKPVVRYGFEYALPARQIAFAEGDSGRRDGSLDFDVAVYDGTGKLVTSLSQTIKLPLSDGQYQQLVKGPFRFFQQVDLPVGQMFVRVGVLDRTSKKVGTLEIPVLVKKL